MKLNELPANSRQLFTIAFENGVEAGIGNANEIRELVADGIFPATIVLTPALHKGAAVYDPE